MRRIRPTKSMIKRLKKRLGIKPILEDREWRRLGEQLIAGFIDGIQLTDPVSAIRIRTLVEEKINERQPELMEVEQ